MGTATAWMTGIDSCFARQQRRQQQKQQQNQCVWGARDTATTTTTTTTTTTQQQQSMTMTNNNTHPSSFSSSDFDVAMTVPLVPPPPTTTNTTTTTTTTTDIYMERVMTKSRALDVLVFRGLQKMSAAEWLQEKQQNKKKEPEQQQEQEQQLWTMKQVVNELMKRYNDRGDPIHSSVIITQQETNKLLPIQYVAIVNVSKYKDNNIHDDNNNNLHYSIQRTNGVVGVIRAQVCNVVTTTMTRKEVTTNRLTNRQVTDDDKNKKENNSLVLNRIPPRPFNKTTDPHIYLSNLRVHEQFRRCGIASALIDTVLKEQDFYYYYYYNNNYYYHHNNFATKHNRSSSSRSLLLLLLPIVLTVDCQNQAALNLYQKKFGFVFLNNERKVVDGDYTMIRYSSSIYDDNILGRI